MMEMNAVTGILVVMGLVIVGMIIAICDLYERFDDLKKTVQIQDKRIDNLKDYINTIDSFHTNHITDLMSRVTDISHNLVWVSNSIDSLDEHISELTTNHEDLVDLVMEMREDIQYCNSKLKSQKRYCKKCRKSSGIDCERIWKEIDNLKLRCESIWMEVDGLKLRLVGKKCRAKNT